MSSNSQVADKKRSPRIRPVPAVSRAIAILRYLGKVRRPQRAKEISDALNLVPSTCLHILRVLTHEKLLTFDPNSKRYRLGSGMLVLARAVLENDIFAQTVQPILDDIAQKWRVTAIGVNVQDTERMIVTSLSKSTLPFRLHVDIGSRFPGLISSTGRLVAAYSNQDLDTLKEDFDRLRWDNPLKFSQWKKEVQEVKQKGYSIDWGQYITGIALIAVPIFGDIGELTHTLVVAGIMQQLSPDEIEALMNELKAYSHQISESLYNYG